MYTKKYFIETSDSDPFLDLKLSSLFLYMQDAATDHVESLGYGKKATMDKGMFWVIIRYSLTIYRMPKYLETINVTTYPGKDMKFIFPRYFEITDEQGNLLVKAASTWCILDKSTHKIVLKPFETWNVNEEHILNEEELCPKIEDINTEFVEERKVRYGDTDLNGHLNNTKYIDYILDIHSKDFYKTHKIKHFEINYEHELMCDDIVRIESKLVDNNEYVKGFVNNQISFRAKITY